LSLPSISLVNDNIVVSNVEVSLTWELGDDGEFLSNVHTPVSPPLSIFEWSLESIQVDDVPLLVKGIVSLEHDNVLAFNISVTRNIHGSSIFDVDNSSIVILEKLEPSGVCGPDLKVGRSTTILDVNRLGVLSNRLDSLGTWIKEEDLVVVLSVVSLDNQVSTSNSQYSLHWESRSDDEGSSKVDLVWNIET